MKPVEFSPHAEREARSAAVYYNSIERSLGVDFEQELRDAIGRVQSNPLMYAVVDPPVRVARLRRFPYLLFYEDLSDRIRVAAVAHNRRRPGYWKSRRRK